MSRVAAADCSPGRKPWINICETRESPAGAKESVAPAGLETHPESHRLDLKAGGLSW